MIARVQKDIQIVCMQYFDDSANPLVDRWVKLGNTKRQLLEDDATRVRQSVWRFIHPIRPWIGMM